MHSTEINEVTDCFNVLGFKGGHHARAGQFVVILKKMSDFWDLSFPTPQPPQGKAAEQKIWMLKDLL